MNELKPLERRTRLASYAVIRDSGSILLCRLAAHTQKAGRWTLPGGGIEFGEAPEVALRREVNEETGLKLDTVRLDRILSEVELYNSVQFHHLRFVYEAQVMAGDIAFESEGTTDLCAWVPEDQVSGDNAVPLVLIALDVR